MANVQEVCVPDIGDVSEVEVIEILVSPGDQVEKGDSLITLESDKASMDVPSPVSGKVKSISVSLGDKVNEGSPVLMMEITAEMETKVEAADIDAPSAPAPEISISKGEATSSEEEVCVPDIGDVSEVEVIEILVSSGDQVEKDDSLITLESDKASMDVPSPVSGKVKSVGVSLGDRVKEGSPILVMETMGTSETAIAIEAKTSQPATEPIAAKDVVSKPESIVEPTVPVKTTDDTVRPSTGISHASPAVRRFARELGADLSKIQGTGPKGRIIQDDVQQFVKASLTKADSQAATGISVASIPDVDFSQFGDIRIEALSRIKKISGAHLHRCWVTIPHVTQNDEADITELEAFRKSLKVEAEKQNVKLTFLPFLMKAVVAALKAHPIFNASLDSSGENLVIKNYYHIGVAVDTPDGLVVPVVRDVDQKGMFALAEELSDIGARARNKKLKPNDLQGGSFTISSLGGIGGTSFTPIINAPEVAILGVSRSKLQPIYHEGEFVPRLMLPVSLSYDHRVIDGASAARFTVLLGKVLSDMRRVLL